ncbi:MAG: hypothetical protein BWZ10_03203 [candidate division BRC1 bacterium ADurb.BinA364]|nr:MAG: hypothetical protein BWZ10_03203 [candidate division BRC1 bacterium ADurb.BinA364]
MFQIGNGGSFGASVYIESTGGGAGVGAGVGLGVGAGTAALSGFDVALAGGAGAAETLNARTSAAAEAKNRFLNAKLIATSSPMQSGLFACLRYRQKSQAGK